MKMVTTGRAVPDAVRLRATDEFGAVWTAHARAVWAYAARRVDAPDADDVVNRVFAVAWQRRGDHPDPDLPWLLGIARNVVREQRRSARRAAGVAERVAAQPRSGSEIDLVQRVAALQALERLDEDGREALMLIAWDGLRADEAARVVGITSAAFRMRLTRARRRLEKEMEANDGD